MSIIYDYVCEKEDSEVAGYLGELFDVNYADKVLTIKRENISFSELYTSMVQALGGANPLIRVTDELFELSKPWIIKGFEPKSDSRLAALEASLGERVNIQPTKKSRVKQIEFSTEYSGFAISQDSDGVDYHFRKNAAQAFAREMFEKGLISIKKEVSEEVDVTRYIAEIKLLV